MADYCATDMVAAELGITDSDDDPMLSLSCTAASRQLEGETGWRFWKDDAVTVRTYRPCQSLELDLVEDQYPGVGIADTTGLIVKVDTYDSGTFDSTLTENVDYILEPLNAGVASPARPFTEICLTGSSARFVRSSYRRPTVQVTALFGWPEVPDDIVKAAVIQAAQLYKAKDAVFGAIALGDTGAAMRVRSGLNPLALGLIAPFMRARLG